MLQRGATGWRAVLRLAVAAFTSLLIASLAYEVRGYDYVNDYKNGGVHDVVTLVVIYSALIAFVVLACAGLVRAMRTVLK